MADKKQYTKEEVAEHASPNDCWIILGNSGNGGAKVADITNYLSDHPGGAEIMLEFAGKNADDMFEDIGHSQEAREKLKELIIGSVKGDAGGSSSEVQKSGAGGADAGKKSGGGLNPLAIIALFAAIVIGFYFSQMKK